VPSHKLPPTVVAIAAVPTVSPWLGFGARLLTEKPWYIAGVGAILWLASCTAIWYLHRLPEMKGKRSLNVSILVWTLTFIPLFVCTAAVTNLILRR
jgi:hypothetical protein